MAASGGGDAGAAAPFSSNGWDVARRSAGCAISAISAIDAVMQGDIDIAYALTCPPGHHAEPEGGKGFCIFSNAALAAEHAIQKYGLKRVAIVDWDVHFGNGTLPPGCGFDTYRESFEMIVISALEAFKPELIVIAFFSLAVMEELSGIKTEAACPFTPQHDLMPAQKLQDYQGALIKSRAVEFQAMQNKHWR